MQNVGFIRHSLKDKNYTAEDDLVYVWCGHTSMTIVRIEAMKQRKCVCYKRMRCGKQGSCGVMGASTCYSAQAGKEYQRRAESRLLNLIGPVQLMEHMVLALTLWMSRMRI